MDVSEFIEAEQIEASVAGHDAGEDTFVCGFDEFVDQLGGGDVADSAALFAGGDPQPDEQMGLAGSGSEGDRLQQLRAVLPCEVRVVAQTHPLFGRLLAAKSFKRWNGVLLLVIDLPDGSPGTIRCDATDVLGVIEPGPRSVLDAAGIRALHGLVVQLATRAEVGVSGVDAQVGSPRP
ncbi:hypothetical protein AWC11_17290 [Mycobacterium interjectum]|nr:hypothetical protein AWC11_17290 [Mycobacterium interjectum]